MIVIRCDGGCGSEQPAYANWKHVHIGTQQQHAEEKFTGNVFTFCDECWKEFAAFLNVFPKRQTLAGIKRRD